MKFFLHFREARDDIILNFCQDVLSRTDDDLERLLFSTQKEPLTDFISIAPHPIVKGVIETTTNWAFDFRCRLQRPNLPFSTIYETHDLGADPHITGIPIALETDNGPFVYKPRPVFVDYTYNKFVEYFGGLLPRSPFKSIVVHCFEGYGFIQFVESRSRPVELMPADFYSVGGILCIIYAFAGTDFHYENIVFSGHGPYLIDLEGLLQPAMKSLSGQSSRTASVLNTGVLPVRVEIGDTLDFDPSIVGSGKFVFRCDDSVALHHFKKGFSDVYNTLMDYRDEIVSSAPFLKFGTSKSRYIPSNTTEYYRALAHYVKRIDAGRLGEVETQIKLGSSSGPNDPFISHEKLALSQGCIPIFQSSNEVPEILTELGERTNADVASNGLDEARYRIQHLMSKSDLDRQTWFIEASFDCHAINAKLPQQNPTDLFPEQPLNAESSLSFARALLEAYKSRLKIGQKGEVFAVLQVRRSKNFDLEYRRVSAVDLQILDEIEGIINRLRSRRGTNEGEALSNIIESILLRSASDISDLGVDDNKSTAESINLNSKFTVRSDIGMCHGVMEEFARNQSISCSSINAFTNGFNRAVADRAVFYGGYFATHSLHVSFGLPCLIVTSLAITLSCDDAYY